MSETFKTRVAAGCGDVFGPSAFDGQIGEVITVRTGKGDVEGVLRGTEIIEEGAAMLLTVEVPDGTLPVLPLGGHSIRSR
jgi:hypothetical protein